MERILRDLPHKLVMVTGPRQSGKTWLCKSIAVSYRNPIYLNYDNFDDRKMIELRSWPATTDLLVLDEIQKKLKWKNYVKGIFDTKPRTMHMLVTGSARLEAFSRAGDSMAGRYFKHRLLPFTPRELAEVGEDIDLARLTERGGFPEPLLAVDAVDAERWRKTYNDDLIRVDVLDFEKIHDFKAIQMVLRLLRRSVGSPVSYQSIARDVGIAHTTVKKYISIFEDLFVVFRVTPFSHNIARSLIKEPKLYFFDTGLVDGDAGARFENLVALSFLKEAFRIEDETGRDVRLHYLRTKEKLEVDFCIVEDEKPLFMAEAKISDSEPARALKKMNARYRIRAIQVMQDLRNEHTSGAVEIVRAEKFLRELTW